MCNYCLKVTSLSWIFWRIGGHYLEPQKKLFRTTCLILTVCGFRECVYGDKVVNNICYLAMFNLCPDMKPWSSHSYCEAYNNLNINEDWLAEYVLALVFLVVTHGMEWYSVVGMEDTCSDLVLYVAQCCTVVPSHVTSYCSTVTSCVVARLTLKPLAGTTITNPSCFTGAL